MRYRFTRTFSPATYMIARRSPAGRRTRTSPAARGRSRSTSTPKPVRAGVHALTLLAQPLNLPILSALGGGPMTLAALTEAVGPAAPSTVRRHLRALAGAGAVALAGKSELTTAGRELLDLATVLGVWLGRSPRGPVALESRAAREPVKALTDAWSAGIVRALAAAPLGLTELDSLIADVSYPSLERRLAAMRRTGQIELVPGSGGRPYTVSRWLRQAAAPLAAAVRWERRWLPGATAPVTRVDVEAGLLLALPLLDLPAELSGSCRLVVELEGRRGSRLAGVVALVAAGRIAALSSRLRGEPDASASGPTGAWLEAVTERRMQLLGLEGGRELGLAVVGGLHDALFAD